MKATRYISTRSAAPSVGIERAVIDGLAPDGGLYVPDKMPRLPARVFDPAPLSYTDLAWLVLAPFFPGWDESWFRAALDASSALFDSPDPVPLVRLDDRIAPAGSAATSATTDSTTAFSPPAITAAPTGTTASDSATTIADSATFRSAASDSTAIAASTYILELFHGPTCAFKDLALSLMGSILRHSLDREGIADRVAILVATSGDTGSAALAGFAHRPGISTVVYYPATGTSLIQRLQMTTVADPSQKVFGIRGNFDDAQRGVKRIFGSSARCFDETGVRLSSANSINMARLLPQIVYYVKAWRDLLVRGVIKPGQSVDFTVPTGNFGDILAARYAKAMGLPVGTLVCASNKNRVLADFFATGTYDRRRDFSVTSSPSMDILVSSNLERAIFESTGRDPVRTASLMKSLAENGHYTLSTTERSWFDDFSADWVDEDATVAEISAVYSRSGYLLDPHTAVASVAARRYRQRQAQRLHPASLSLTPMVVCATASPFKFPAVCLGALSASSSTPGPSHSPDPSHSPSPSHAPNATNLSGLSFSHTGHTDQIDQIGHSGQNDLDLARVLSARTGILLPSPIASLVGYPVPAESPNQVPSSKPSALPAERHTEIIDPSDMESALIAFLKGD